MPLTDEERYERMCYLKHGWRSKRDAKRARGKFQSVIGGRAMDVYRCPYCGLWHMGHSQPRAKGTGQ